MDRNGGAAGYMAEFEQDVFVSYAHRDNDQIAGEAHGWVDTLHEDLSRTVNGILGRDARIWRDPEIRNNEDFEKKIVARLGSTAAFLSIVSASFVNSEWCRREVREFAERAEKRLGLLVDGDKKRIFKVERFPVDRDTLPDSMQGTTTYQFFDKAKERPLRPHMIAEDAKAYYERLVDLAKDIARLVSIMQRTFGEARPPDPAGRSATAAPGAASPAAQAVYVAEASSDLDDAVDQMRRDLKDRGYVVLPDGDLPRRAADYRRKVEECLARCDVAIHPVGIAYGFVPEGETKLSNVAMQHELALARAESGGLKQVVWIPDAQRDDPRQVEFVRYLREDPRATAKAELLEGGVEDVKTEVLDGLARAKKERDRAEAERKEKEARAAAQSAATKAPDGAPGPVAAEPPLVYVVCDRADRGSPGLKALRRTLIEAGCEPMLPLQDAEDADALADHREKLASCDASIIYWGAGPPRWFEAKLADYRKSLRNRTPPVKAKAVVIVGSDADKEEAETLEAELLRVGDAFDPAALANFLGKLPRPAP
ncbi:MAG: toll/interleukin-1 receptor domain-containing protein [Hyphomicrobiales bacterium]|nr:toll/interleukin-1 receptor domain-containing protein [Hyphomicrobiales bacterium]